MRYTLHDFQTEMVARCRRAYGGGHHGVMLQSETGTGKTVMFCHIVETAVAKGARVVLLVHTRELLAQTAEKLRANGVDHGVVAAGYRNPSPLANAQVCMVHSLQNRSLTWEPTLIIIDEAHLAIAPTYVKLCTKRWPTAKRLLVTATPWRSDRRGFRLLASELVIGPTYMEQVARGFLVPIRHWSTPWVDVSKLVVKNGEYESESAAAAYGNSKVLGDIVHHYQRLSMGRPAITFGANVAHSKQLADEFNAAGVPTRHLDGTTPATERAAIIDDLKTGRILNVTNCAVLTTGFDCPRVSCIVLAKPTMSPALYKQMGGRGTRPSDGKSDLHLHDHGRNVETHGLLDQPWDYSLDDEERDPKKAAKRGVEIKTCDLCFAMFAAAECADGFCPACHMPMRTKGLEVPKADTSAELVDVGDLPSPDRKVVRRRKIADWRLWGHVDKERKARGESPGWTWTEYWRRVDAKELLADPWLEVG